MKRDDFEHQLVPSPTTAAHEEKILRRLFHRYPGGLAVRLPSGATLTLGAHAPEFTLVFKHPGVIRDLVLSQDPLQLAEAYFSDCVDFEGDIYRVLSVKDHLQSLTLSAFDKAALAGAALKLRKPDDEAVQKDVPSGVRWLRSPFFRKHSKKADRCSTRSSASACSNTWGSRIYRCISGLRTGCLNRAGSFSTTASPMTSLVGARRCPPNSSTATCSRTANSTR